MQKGLFDYDRLFITKQSWRYNWLSDEMYFAQCDELIHHAGIEYTNAEASRDSDAMFLAM